MSTEKESSEYDLPSIVEVLTGDNHAAATAGQTLTHLTDAAPSISGEDSWLHIHDPGAHSRAAAQTNLLPAPAEALGEPEPAC